jgi:hypothetical protein
VLLLEALEADALLDLGLLAEQLENRLHVGDVLPGLLEMALEPGLELLIGDLADQLRERLVCQRALDVEDVAEFVEEEVARCCELRHSCPFDWVGTLGYPSRPIGKRRLHRRPA